MATHVAKTIWRTILVIIIILLVILAIKFIRGIDRGVAQPEQKGSPVSQGNTAP